MYHKKLLGSKYPEYMQVALENKKYWLWLYALPVSWNSPISIYAYMDIYIHISK